MKGRSLSELKALESAYLTCLDIIDFLENVIANPDSNDKEAVKADKLRLKNARVFTKWYQKKILLVEYNDYICPNCKMEHKIKESNKEIVAFCKSCGHPIWPECIKN